MNAHILENLLSMVLLTLVVAQNPGAPVASARSAMAEDGIDLAVRNLELTQGVPDEPLILGKLTAARVQIVLTPNTNLDAQVQLEVDGKTYERTVNLTGPAVTVTLKVDAPREVKPITATVFVTPTGQTTGPNLSDHSKTVTYQTVQTTERVVAFFLPVDWTPEERSKYDYNNAFKQHVQEAGGFLVSTYPLPTHQVIVDYTMTPHMLSPFEQTLVDSQGKFNMRNALALYANLSFAGRRYRPDATMVVGVLPPGWFRAHGQPGTLGFTLSDVKGIVTGQYGSNLPPIIAAHEIGHLYSLDEDYDFAIKPNRPCTPVLLPSYWAEHEMELIDTSAKRLCTFMSAASSQDNYWVDQRIYDYLLGKFALNGGAASAPLVLAATMTWRVESDGSPGRTSANVHRFEPSQPVYVSVAGIALRAGSTLEAKLYRGDTLLRALAPQTTTAGNRWYPFLTAKAHSLPEDIYRVDIYLDGRLAKSNQFEVKTSQ